MVLTAQSRRPGMVPGRRIASYLVILGLAAALLGGAAVYVLYETAPKGDEGQGPVDALLVLGTPAGLHGELTEMQRWRVDEAVKEYRLGVAPRILFSGGPTSNGFVEADVMGAYAVKSGVPAGAVFKERRAMTTLQNIANSQALLQTHGWTHIEVISTEQHLPRAAVLLEKTNLHWRTHVAPTPDRGWADMSLSWVEEAVGTAVFRAFGTRAEPVLHTLARGQHGLSWCTRWILYRVQDFLRR